MLLGMKAFCPKCGQETDGIGPRGLCEDCYVEEHELIEVPDRMEVAVCQNCGAAKIGPDWVQVDGERDLIFHVLDHNIEGENVVAVSYTRNEDPNAPQTLDVTILVEKAVDGVPMQAESETSIIVHKEQCMTCSKFEGGYYTYKIQIRGDVPDSALEPLMDRAAELTNRDREHFIADVQESEHGFDIYTSTRTMAEELLKELESHYPLEKQRSKELVGQEEGQEVYRSVISARIIPEER